MKRALLILGFVALFVVAFCAGTVIAQDAPVLTPTIAQVADQSIGTALPQPVPPTKFKFEDSAWFKFLAAIWGTVASVVGLLIASLLGKYVKAATAQKYRVIVDDIIGWFRAKYPDSALPDMINAIVDVVMEKLPVSREIAERLVSGAMSDKGLVSGDMVSKWGKK